MAQQDEGGMGENELVYQFVAGLIDPLKVNVVGTKGTFDELLSKARFEEARLREVLSMQNRPRAGREADFQPRLGFALVL